MLIQSTTVGKAATFTKVDAIIKETRAIMHLAVRVLQICYANADKYDLDFSHISSEGGRAALGMGGGDVDMATFGGSSSSGGGGNTSGSDS